MWSRKLIPVWIEVLPAPSRLTAALMLVSLVSLFIFDVLGSCVIPSLSLPLNLI